MFKLKFFLNQFKNRVYNRILKFICKWMQKASKKIYNDIIEYVKPVKRNISGLKSLVSILAIYFFIFYKDEKEFSLIRTTENDLYLAYEDLVIPIYMQSIEEVLKVVFKIPEVNTEDEIFVDLERLSKVAIEKILNESTNKV